MTQTHVDDAEERLAEFLSKFTPEIEARAFKIIAAMRQPGGVVIKSISARQRPRRPAQ
jgi:hypothetical protein